MKEALSNYAIIYRRLVATDAAIYREFWLNALRLSPRSFGSSYEEEQPKDVSVIADAIARATIFGAWTEAGDLIGTAGMFLRAGAKSYQHKAVLFGVFVALEWRERGIGDSLVREVIREARLLAGALQLTVSTETVAAVRLYAACGFQEYGLERRALKVGDHHVDLYLMELVFDD
jgi:ribosomal protein S18 acetylase RimI-like enzyme